MTEESQNNSVSIGILFAHVKELETSLEHVLERLHQLEEKERARASADHAREEALDFANAEGLKGC